MLFSIREESSTGGEQTVSPSSVLRFLMRLHASVVPAHPCLVNRRKCHAKMRFRHQTPAYKATSSRATDLLKIRHDVQPKMKSAITARDEGCWYIFWVFVTKMLSWDKYYTQFFCHSIRSFISEIYRSNFAVNMSSTTQNDSLQRCFVSEKEMEAKCGWECHVMTGEIAIDP